MLIGDDLDFRKTSASELPLISIITVVLNSEELLEQTILSVINQTYPKLEYIIIDGGSTDKTIEIIKNYENKITYWISEKDHGIYDAMNKGIILAKGEWLNFMNAGDMFYHHKILTKIFYYKKVEADIIYGNNIVIYPNKIRIVKAGKIKNLSKGSQFSHQSAFIASKLHKKFLFNINNKIAADFEFFYNVYQKKIKFLYLDIIISKILSGGISDRKRLRVLFELWSTVGFKNILLNLYYVKKIFNEFIKNIIKFFL